MNRRSALNRAGLLGLVALTGCAGMDQKTKTALDSASDWAKQARGKIQQAQFLLGQVSAQLSAWRAAIPPDVLAKLDAGMAKAQEALDVAAELAAMGDEKIEEAKQAWSGNWLPALRTVLDLLASLGMFVPALSKLQPPPTASIRVDGEGASVGAVQVDLPADEL